MFCSFHPLADKTNNKHLPKPFFKDIRKSLYWNCFLLSVTTDAKDGHGLKLGKVRPTFSSFMQCLQNSGHYHGKRSLMKFVGYLNHISNEAFCVWLKAQINAWLIDQLITNQQYPGDMTSLQGLATTAMPFHTYEWYLLREKERVQEN